MMWEDGGQKTTQQSALTFYCGFWGYNSGSESGLGGKCFSTCWAILQASDWLIMWGWWIKWRFWRVQQMPYRLSYLLSLSLQLLKRFKYTQQFHFTNYCSHVSLRYQCFSFRVVTSSWTLTVLVSSMTTNMSLTPKNKTFLWVPQLGISP